MKKILLIFLAVLLCLSPLAAEQRHAVTFDPMMPVVGAILGGFGLGLSYEFALFPLFSLRLSGSYLQASVGNYGLTLFNALSEARFYPFSEGVRGLYLNAGVNVQGISIHNETQGALMPFGNLIVGLGYKVVFSKNKGSFFFEPSFGWNIALWGEENFADAGVGSDLLLSLLGVKSIRYGVSIGIAF